MFGWLWRKLKTLWQLAKSERASPKEIGWAIFVGVFCGCTPALGFHTVVVLAAATLFRVNRLFAWIGSRSSNALILPFIIIAEIQVAHIVRTGSWATLDRHTIDWEHPFHSVGPLVIDWFLGTIPVGSALGAVFGLGAWRLAVIRDRRKAAANALRDAERTGNIE